MLQARVLLASTGFCLSWAALGRLALAGRLPTGKARLARRLQFLDGGADVCKTLQVSCQGHRAQHTTA